MSRAKLSIKLITYNPPNTKLSNNTRTTKKISILPFNDLKQTTPSFQRPSMISSRHSSKFPPPERLSSTYTVHTISAIIENLDGSILTRLREYTIHTSCPGNTDKSRWCKKKKNKKKEEKDIPVELVQHARGYLLENLWRGIPWNLVVRGETRLVRWPQRKKKSRSRNPRARNDVKDPTTLVWFMANRFLSPPIDLQFTTSQSFTSFQEKKTYSHRLDGRWSRDLFLLLENWSRMFM